MNHAVTALCVSEDLYGLYEIVETLKASGHSVIAACSYPRAVALAAAEKIDIVVAGGTKPHESVSGPASIKSARPDLPILFVSRFVNNHPVPEGVDLHAKSVKEIAASIRKLLSRSDEKLL